MSGLFLQIGSKQTKFKGCSACLSPLRQIWYLFIYGLDIVISDGILSNNIREINFILTNLVFILKIEIKKFIKCIEIIKSRKGNLIHLIFTKVDATIMPMSFHLIYSCFMIIAHFFAETFIFCQKIKIMSSFLRSLTSPNHLFQS